MGVARIGSDFYFRRLLERWRRANGPDRLNSEEKQRLVNWDKTPEEFRARLKHEIAEEARQAPKAAT